ncbi:ABC transporter ATP-binding protein [Paenibacillus sp. GSMTC-2017]|uniref:ABC transporter ATP-binding protein n=1 Tax=Paenibacillus sp. GSMTC-2017 TaxID=2794350 RepID=UPI0018D789DE|nr:ABC transporter ATP-binding protein [Paenibacillus sp. GSMTC-2017]MBH5319546.1 ABC transporter ATP-binding protein [Paenibacillus sp. GSMTC-2017]
MNVIEVRNVSKSYLEFSIKDVSLDIKKGFITGLIGANGAGKSTLINMILGIVRPKSGSIQLFGMDMPKHEVELKQRIGIVSDDCYYYEHLTIEDTKRIIAPFYRKWDETKFRNCLDQFELSPKKKVGDLSKGMKVKFSLAIALSHEAELLIMDEPTSGLDPVFRRELLDILADIIQDEQKSIIFSTHITTDLDRIADYITFVNRGQIVFSDVKDDVLGRYSIVKGGKELLDPDIRRQFVGVRETAVGFEGLVADRKKAAELFGDYALLEKPSLEDIMYFTAKGGPEHVKFTS